MRLFVSCARKIASQSARATRTPSDRVWGFPRERENVGQEGFDALVHRLSPQCLARAFSAPEVCGWRVQAR
jgi:hypothetical protein